MKIGKNVIKSFVIISFIAFCAAVFLSSSLIAPVTDASGGGAPTGRTGAPGETTCTACHNQNTLTGQFAISAPSNYVPNQTYVIQVQHTTTDASRLRWGFELIPVTSANAMAGTVANLNTNTRIRTAGTKSYVTHTTAGTFPGQQMGATWSFNWTAPSADVGPITMYAAGLQADNSGDEDGDQTYTRSAMINPAAVVVIHHGFSDFDGDGRADPSVFRPSTGIWYLNRSTSGFAAAQWGTSTDKLTPADFDGDDKADIAVWRPDVATVAAFYILQSSNGTVRTERFGQTGDVPVAVGDWDGDGRADPAVYRNGSQGYFYFRGSLNNPGGNITYLPWGTAGDMPTHGDFDGDGKQDPAVFRPSNSTWYILQSSNGQIRYDYWGLSTDKFVNADYDGDGKTDLAVFRSGMWYIKQSLNGQAAHFTWGTATDVPVPADYDGDAKTDVAVYRNGTWYIRMSTSGSLSVASFGLGSDLPVPNTFVQ